MVYQFKEGQTYRGISDAQVVGETLEQLRLKSGGKLFTEQVVKAAKSTKSPIHSAFTWDDVKAATEYRKWEAMHLVKSVCVLSEEGEKVAAFITVRADNEETEESETFYQAISIITSKPDQYASAIQICQKALDHAEQNLNLLLSIVPVKKKKNINRAIQNVKTARMEMIA